MQGSDATKTLISTVFFARLVISGRLTACHRDAVRAYCGSGGRWFESTQLYQTQPKSPPLQHLVDKPNVFVPQKIQKALQMALRMVTLSRRNGHWFARKGIPADVREEYARLYGVRREAHLKLPGDTPRAEAKIRNAEWTAEIETRIATLRAQQNGEGQPLTRLNAIALAGRWYNWFVKQHEDDPGPARDWRLLSDLFVELVRD